MEKKTFRNQDSLPRLPVPTLENTLKIYLKSVKPLLPGSEFRKYSAICHDFGTKLGPILQQRLVEYDKTQPYSWLEKWWLELAYLSWRNSLLINSNWYIVFRDHPNSPRITTFKEGFTEFQIYRAAGFVTNLLNYMERLHAEDIPSESTKQGPIDMNQYRNVFGITRVPKPGCDEIVGTFPAQGKHILIHVKDQIFQLPVYDKKGNRLKISILEQLLNECVSCSDEPQLPIGILTAQDRDSWADDHAYLQKLDAKNSASFRIIESALFSICLDHRILLPDLTSLAKATFHGFDGHNIWFDKSISVVITNDGRLGVNGEHSPCDAVVPALILENAVAAEPAKDPLGALDNPTIEPIKHLQFVGDEKINSSLERAQSFISKAIADSDLKVVFMAKYGKVSPDAYMQLALQLTFYRIHGYCAAVYESSSTRKYLHGRTETCRSLTLEQQQFVENFDRPISNKKKYEYMKHACAAHVNYITQASHGFGCDRHLLGLKMVMKKGESHEIFSHPAFAKSTKWQLSTSALFSSDKILGTGFGTAYPDGYGMNYTITSETIKIGVESKVHDQSTSSEHYIKQLEVCLDDLKNLCTEVDTIKSKL